MKPFSVILFLLISALSFSLLISCKKTKNSTGSLQVNVQEENAKPVPLATVILDPGGKSQLTDTNGNASFTELDESETFLVKVTKTNYDTVIRQSIEIYAGQTTKITVLLNQSVGDLKVKILDEHAVPVSLATVLLNPGDRTMLSDESGYALFKAIQKGGPYKATVCKQGYDTVDQTGIQIKGGEINQVTILLPTSPKLHVSDSILDFDSTKNQLPLMLSNSGTGSFNWELVAGSCPWLSVHPIEGTVTGSETNILIADIDRSKLAEGANECTFYINALTAGLQKITVKAFSPKPVVDSTVTDYDGNIYKIIKIGSQFWLDKNLHVTHNPNGIPITNYYYESNPSYLATYGRLYTWDVAMNGSQQEGAQGICPDGWHIPDYSEFQALFNYLGGISIAGGKLKETGTDHWQAPNEGANNSSGFTAVPGGDYWYDGTYHYLHQRAFFWTSSAYTSDQSYCIYLHYINAEAVFFPVLNTDGFSIRCIKD